MSRFFFISVMVLAVAVLPSSAGAAETCFADWSVAAPIVQKEGLIAVEKLTPLAKSKLNGDIVKVTLCEADGSYVFRLVVKDARGNLKTVTVDAKNPF